MSTKLPAPRRRPSVALLIETSNAFSRELLHGVREWARANGPWGVHLSEQGRGNQPPRWLRSWRGDGIIARVENAAIARAVRACGVPVVNVSAAEIAPEFPAVTSDSSAIGRLAAEHLLACGLRHFGYCGDARFRWSRRHGENFAAALKAAGHRCTVYPAVADDAADWRREEAKLRRWLRDLPRPAGVFACYDIRGQQVLDVCRAAGIRVPDEIAVVGQHNDELLCELCDPPLSSVIPDARRAGSEAAGLLARLMRGGRARPGTVAVPPLGVATRQSTDMVAVDDPGLARAVRFMREHHGGPIGVGDIAREAGLSRSLLERRFRAAFGTSPWSQVMQLRKDAAEAYLTQTNLSIAEIAERTGFGSPEHFSAAYRRLAGRPPSALRRR